MSETLICFSHLRWNFVYQRPQHLMTRFARQFQIYFFEEPVFDAQDEAALSISRKEEHISVVVPHLPPGLSKPKTNELLTLLLSRLLQSKNNGGYIFWYYTPMALEFSDDFQPKLTVYDCMDELSAFKFAPPELKILEKRLMAKADLVFTGGHSLYEAKKNQHSNIYPFPSSIEKAHFSKARKNKTQPADQPALKGLKIGFYGVIDERFDSGLIKGIAEARPEWNLVLIGPVVKIDPAVLPQRSNIHYLGPKKYEELPAYLSGWDLALIPFTLNESTRFISPTKTPEYLAAGVPVISTPIRDVVQPYGTKKMVRIASNVKEFIEAIETEMQRSDRKQWLKMVDKYLALNSWDKTCADMLGKMTQFEAGKAAMQIAS